MARRYLLLAILSFVAYSLVAPLLKVAMEVIPSTVAVFLSNFVMMVLLGLMMIYRRESPVPHMTHSKSYLVVLGGILLAVGLLSYYRALALGPVSIVVPIYGLFIAISSVIGIVALDEALTTRKVVGIACAVLAIALMSV